MKTFLIAAGWLAGLIYGFVAVVMVYSGSPLALQAFIVIGVTTVGTAAGYLLSALLGLASPKNDG